MSAPTPTIGSAEVVAVGTELLLGEIVDTNSAWLARELAERGVDVYWSQRVGDNLERLQLAIAGALERSDLVLLTGGLGPTDDDMTREAVAAVLGETPEVDPELERDLRARFATFARRMPERNLKQAWRIPSATPLPNPLGTAPGWLVRTERGDRTRWIAALPGPPRELERMWHRELVPRLELRRAALFATTLKSHGLGESTVAERLEGWTERGNPSVATYAKRDGVHVRVAAKADDPERARAIAEPAVEAVVAALGEHLWGRDDDELPARVLAHLHERKLALASVEAATGGRLASLLSAATGASGAYRGGVIAWNAEAIAPSHAPADAHDAPPDGPDATRAGTTGTGSDRPEEPSDPPSNPPSDPLSDLPGDLRALRDLARRGARRFGADRSLFVGPMLPASPEADETDDDGREDDRDDDRGVRVAFGVVAANGPPDSDVVETVRLPALGDGWLRERVAHAALHLLLRSLEERVSEPT